MPALSISGPFPPCQPPASEAVLTLCPLQVPVGASVTAFNVVWAML